LLHSIERGRICTQDAKAEVRQILVELEIAHYSAKTEGLLR
jgi:hypothetical protein